MKKAILLAFLAGGALTGCVGVVGPGYDEGPGYYDEGPDLFIFGGFGGGHDRDFGRRGAESRGAAGHFGGHSGGGHDRR